MAPHSLASSSLQVTPGNPSALKGAHGACHLAMAKPLAAVKPSTATKGNAVLEAPNALKASTLLAPNALRSRSAVKAASRGATSRGAVGVRAAGFDGPQSAKEAAAPSMHAPSTWPNAQPSIGPGHYEYLPFYVPFKMIMGIQPLDPDEWIQMDPFYAEEMSMKRHLIDTRKDIVLQSLPEAEEANKELLELLLEYLPRRYPDVFKMEGSRISNSITGETFDVSDPGMSPLELAGRLVQEDLNVMLPIEDGKTFILGSGSVCFPIKWSLKEKLGMTTADIHLPVPLYHEKIVHQVDSFMANLKVGRPYWRSNWFINSDPTLHRPLTEEQHEGAKDVAIAAAQKALEEAEAAAKAKLLAEPVTVENAGERLFTRAERQTFVRFPRTQAVLFTIRTFIKPLNVFEGRPQLAAECVRAMDELPDSVQRYKMLPPIKGIARKYLVRCSEGLIPDTDDVPEPVTVAV